MSARITSIVFHHFKAFERFSLVLDHVSVLTSRAGVSERSDPHESACVIGRASCAEAACAGAIAADDDRGLARAVAGRSRLSPLAAIAKRLSFARRGRRLRRYGRPAR